MSLHFKVNTDFEFFNGKLSLIGLSINSTTSACTTIPQQISIPLLKTYRILSSLEEAHTFIAHLKKVYPESVHLPVEFDSGQKEILQCCFRYIKD